MTTATMRRPVVSWPSSADVAGLWAASGWPSLVPRSRREAQLIVYGDFTCPYSFLASQRVDALRRNGTPGIEWRAVEHDPTVPVDGRSTTARFGAWDRELAEVATVALPDELVPRTVPALISNTAVAVAAYAGLAGSARPRARRALFNAVWRRQRLIGRLAEVLRVLDVAGVAESSQEVGIWQALAWREVWLALPDPMVPVVVRPEAGIVMAGADALAYLGGLLSAGASHPRSA